MTRISILARSILLGLLFIRTLAAEPYVAGWTRHAATNPALAGTVLLGELGCTACHATTRPELTPKPAPDLSAVGDRVLTAHLQRFIETPLETKPGTTMPGLLGHLPEAGRADTALALTHFLASLRDPQPSPAPAAADPDGVARGRQLYHSVGCVACHSPEAALPDSVPLGPLEAKYTVASLARFLGDPLAVRPGGRMPDLKLDLAEAQDIARYLLRNPTPPARPFTPEPALAGRGKALFRQLRCDACHTGLAPAATAAPPTPPSLDRLRPDRGCLSGQPGAWPRYALSDAQRAALRTALASPTPAGGTKENVDLTLARLNCLACHERDGLGGVPADRNPHFTGRDENLGDQGRLPPPLTGVGAKLKEIALRDVIVSGEAARPYLNTRMPRFGSAAAELAGWFKQIDTLPPAEFTRARNADKPQEVGRDLAGSKGLNCIACHTFRGQSAGSLRALDLMLMAGRLEENWFHHYMSRPQRFSPLTLMPDFWPDGKSPLPDVLGGDPGRQRDALWQYLARGADAPEPRGLVLPPLVVAVSNEAVILRRAFPGIGKRGIGVGYPSGIHLSFDAGQMRLGSVWTGGFIEASALWRGQGAGQAHLLGKDVVNFPAGPAFALLDSPASPWPTNTAKQAEGFAFKGYTLDATRRPTFRYAFGDVLIEDVFLDRREPAGRPHFVRSIAFPQRPPPPGLYFRVARAPQIAAQGSDTFILGKGLRLQTPPGALLRDADGARELLLPVKGPFTLEYHPNP